jgi:hypothetical protein
MKNLEQIRAAQALRFWNSEPARRVAGREGGDPVQKLPVLILSNGLLATIAFAKANGAGFEILAREIGEFLSPGHMNVLPAPAPDLDHFIKVLTHEKSDSLLLQRATTEALAYLAYLKRLGPNRRERLED